MAQPEDIRRIRERLEGHSGPVLSVYLSVNARFGENQGQAYKVRLKNALEDLEAPEDVSGRVWEEVEEEYRPGARTQVFFAGEDLFERYDLQVDVPEAFRYGEPYLAPLVLALDEHEPYGVALLDAERFRFFVSAPMESPGGGSDGGSSSFFREVDASPGSPGPRSGRDQETISRRTEAHIHQWYNELGELTRKLAFQNGVRHLILAGPRERTSEFQETLPQEVRERVVAEEQVPTGAPEGEILDRLEEVYERAEREREAGLVEQVRESGVRGVKDTVEALQEGRVYHLIALWGLEGEIRWCDHDQLSITDITREECPFCGRDTRIRSLADVILDLATARSARVEYIRAYDPVAATPNEDERQRGAGDPTADALRDEFEGLAGLTRY